MFYRWRVSGACTVYRTNADYDRWYNPLGADDKAGVAEIMTMAEQLCSHPEIIHGDITIAFTPDEEVGGGMDHFDVGRFGADYAYTVDGGVLGELEYENFNARRQSFM